MTYYAYHSFMFSLQWGMVPLDSFIMIASCILCIGLHNPDTGRDGRGHYHLIVAVVLLVTS